MPLEDGRMHRFVATLLAEGGALVEPLGPDALEVLAPPPLQAVLGLGEMTRLGFGATLPEGARRVGIESDWLGRFQRVIGERGRHNSRALAPYGRKPPAAERLLDQELCLDNATFRLLDVAPAWTRYLMLDFRFTAMSDEKREGVQRLAVNLATGAMPDAMADRFAPWLEGDEVELPADAIAPPNWDRGRLTELVQQALRWRIDAALAPFVKALHRRLERDQDRLHAYYNDLHREAVRRTAQAPDEDLATQRGAARTMSIARDYQAKLDDLARKYALRTTVEWVQTLELIAPVHRLTVQIRRRKAERILALDFSSLTRKLETPPCEATWSAERPRLVCDDAVHLVSLAGLAPCDGCGRIYCRACHSQRCPKCGHTSRGALRPTDRRAAGPPPTTVS